MTGARIPTGYIAEQLGALRENMERGREDRAELKEEMRGIRQGLDNLQQAQLSQSGILAELAKQDLAGRLTKVENRLSHMEKAMLSAEQVAHFNEMTTAWFRWRKWLKSGKSLFWRLVVGFATCSATAGFIIAGILHIWGH
jgi:hypothetical protein